MGEVKPLGYVSRTIIDDLAEGDPSWLYPQETPSLSVPVYTLEGRRSLCDSEVSEARIPMGWHLVPEVPTDDQMSAGLYQASHDATADDVCLSYMDMVRTPVNAPRLFGGHNETYAVVAALKEARRVLVEREGFPLCSDLIRQIDTALAKAEASPNA